MKKKQLVCSTLAAAMLMSSAVPGAGAARFSDVGGHWGESSINRWGSTGVIVGTDGRIDPNGAITRGEMASIIAEMLGLFCFPKIAKAIDREKVYFLACGLPIIGLVLLFLLGFSAAGVVLIPALSGVFGFFTMYTVSCFVRCYGRAGAALALGAMVVRLVFTLPCFFLLAEAAWPLSTELFALSFGRGKRSSPVLYGSRYFLWFVLCAVILALGVFCERLLTPLLFRLALGAI